MAGKRVFVREATGLVRAWSPVDALIYNWIGHRALVINTNLGNQLWALPLPRSKPCIGSGIVPVLVLIPTFLVYAMLASSMPRTGDYVWNSRIIHPALAFALTFTLVVWSLNWMYWDAYGVAVLAFSPIATLTGNIALGIWLAGPSGIMTIGVVFTIITVLLTLRGMGFYAKFQRVAFVLSVLAFAIFVGIMALASKSDFIQSLNSFYAYNR